MTIYWIRLRSGRKGYLDASEKNTYIRLVPYSPLALANTFVAHHGESGSLDHMKLQKLAFYTYGWWLVYNPAPLLTEPPQVWKYGPVFPSLYNALRPFGGKPINAPVGPPARSPSVIPESDLVAIQWVDWVWRRYGHLDALTLSDMTHEIGTPWQIEAAANNYRVPNNHPIPDPTTRVYFQGLAANLT